MDLWLDIWVTLDTARYDGICLFEQEKGGRHASKCGFGESNFRCMGYLVADSKKLRFTAWIRPLGRLDHIGWDKRDILDILFLGGLTNVESCVSFAIVLLRLLMSDMYKER
jgi:hypothetical protein